MNPPCKLCGTTTLRWAWYEAPNEPIQYWYCLQCDLANRQPYIQIHPRMEPTSESQPK